MCRTNIIIKGMHAVRFRKYVSQIGGFPRLPEMKKEDNRSKAQRILSWVYTLHNWHLFSVFSGYFIGVKIPMN